MKKCLMTMFIAAVSAVGSNQASRLDGRTQPMTSTVSRDVAPSGPMSYAIAVTGADIPAPMQFGALNIRSGRFQPIAMLPASAQCIARSGGTIYIVDAANNLARVIPGNGKTEIIGNTGVTTPGPVGAVAVDSCAALSNGDLFLLDYSNNLYSVDTSTGKATLIGATGIPAIASPIYASSLAGSCDALFFTIDEVDENLSVLLPPTLYRIDPQTASATLVGPTAGFLTGSAFIDGSLYAFRLDQRLLGGPRPPAVFSIDTSSGTAALIGALNVPLVGGAVAWAAGTAAECKRR